MRNYSLRGSWQCPDLENLTVGSRDMSFSKIKHRWAPQKFKSFPDLQTNQTNISLRPAHWEISRGTQILKIRPSNLKLYFFSRINHAWVPKNMKSFYWIFKRPIFWILKWPGPIYHRHLLVDSFLTVCGPQRFEGQILSYEFYEVRVSGTQEVAIQ